MISEDYCSEELTKLLLEKGCPLDKVIKQDGRPVYFTLPTDHPNWADCDVYYIPTYAQVMKWLREKGIYINIIYTGEIYHYFVVNIFDSNNEVWYKNSIEESTYEEAVEAALKYCLTKLI